MVRIYLVKIDKIVANYIKKRSSHKINTTFNITDILLNIHIVILTAEKLTNNLKFHEKINSQCNVAVGNGNLSAGTEHLCARNGVFQI